MSEITNTPLMEENEQNVNRSTKSVRAGVLNFFSVLLAILGIGVAAATLYCCVHFYGQPPILLSPPDDAKNVLTTMMDAVCDGDYEQASRTILGTPDFGADRESDSDVGILFWNAMRESMDYELVGDCYTTDSGLAQNITFTYLELESVTSQLGEKSKAMLEQRVQQAEDPSEIYDEDHNYREDVVMEILHDSAVEAIEENAKTITVELTVNLTYQNGQWWVVADKALLHAISGGILY